MIKLSKRLTVMLAMVTLASLVVLLASAGYAAKETHTMKHWHPMFVEPALSNDP